VAAVIHLVEYRSKDTAQVLQALADKAKRGEVIAVALCFRTADQEEHIAFTGTYRTKPGEAVNAAMRISWRLTQLQDHGQETGRL
jgi:hypothetical protein